MSVVALCLLLLFYHGHTALAQVGQFPQPISVSLDRPVFATSTCGDEAETFCEYTSDADLPPNCMSAVCNSTCTYGSSSPSPIDIAAIGTKGTGVTSLNSSTGPGTTAVFEFTNSFISIAQSPKITTNGLTFAVWIKQDSSNNG